MTRSLKLCLIVLSFFVYFLISPPFQAPDEPEHYQIIYFLTRLQYPRLVQDVRTSTNYQLLDTFEKVFNTTRVASENYVIPDFGAIKKFVSMKNTADGLPRIADPLSKQGHQPVLYHVLGAVFFSLSSLFHLDMVSQYYTVRALSTLFYFLSVFFAYHIFKYVFRKTAVAENLTVFFALNPVTLKAGIAVNPDIALVFFSLFSLWVTFKIGKKISLKHVLLFTLLSGLAVWTKFQGVVLVPFFIFIFFRKDGLIKKSVIFSLLFLTAFLFVIFHWFLLNIMRYGAPIIDNFSIMGRFNLPHYSLLQSLVQAVFEFRHTVMHYAGFWGWGDPYPFKPFFLIYAVMFLFLSFMGAAVAILRKNASNIALHVFLSSLLVFLFLVALRHKLTRFSGDIQGRYLLPVFVVFVVYLAEGMAFFLRKKIETVSGYFFYFTLFQYFFVLCFVIIPKYYV